MQDKVQLTLNGQELRVTEFNDVANEAAHADDLVLGEILRMAPYDGSTVTRGVMPFGYRNAGNNVGLILGVAGGFHVNQFRAVVGSRTSLATSPALNYTDIRSAVFTSASGQTIAIPAGGGTSRVHLVYCTLFVDVEAATESRLVKDPTTANVAATSVIPKLQTYVTVSMVSVTSGSIPALPADPTNGYNIPLAYIRTAGSWTTSSSLAAGDVLDASTVVSPFRNQVGPANKIWYATAALQSGIGFSAGAGTFQNWSTFTEARPRTYMPMEMNGTVTRFVPIRIANSDSFPDNTIVDDSIDWRDRVFKCVGQVTSRGENGGSDAGTNFAWNGSNSIPKIVNNVAAVPVTLTQLGNSLTANTHYSSRLTVFSANNTNAAAFMTNASDTVELYVDSSTGALKVHWLSAGGDFTVFVWLEASHPFTNK